MVTDLMSKIKRDMKERIEVTIETRKEITKIFGVTERTVSNALNYAGTRGETDLARRIRKYAAQKGGETYVILKKDEYDDITSKKECMSG